MSIPDQKILQLIDLIKRSGQIKYDKEFCDAIGLRKQNLIKIKSGNNHFTPEHIEKTIKNYNINANWIFGVSDKIFID